MRIEASFASIVSENHSSGNVQAGIVGKGIISHNIVFANTGDGIQLAQHGSTVIGNSVTNNGGYGLRSNGSNYRTIYTQNVFDGNTGGTILDSAAVSLPALSNMCNGAAC